MDDMADFLDWVASIRFRELTWACLTTLWRYVTWSQTTLTRDSSWNMLMDRGLMTTEHIEETTENGWKQNRSRTTETFPYPNYEREGDSKRKDQDAPNETDVQCFQSMPKACARMERQTCYTTLDQETADTMAKNDAESEKKQMEITRAIVDMLAARNTVK